MTSQKHPDRDESGTNWLSSVRMTRTDALLLVVSATLLVVVVELLIVQMSLRRLLSVLSSQIIAAARLRTLRRSDVPTQTLDPDDDGPTLRSDLRNWPTDERN